MERAGANAGLLTIAYYLLFDGFAVPLLDDRMANGPRSSLGRSLRDFAACARLFFNGEFRISFDAATTLPFRLVVISIPPRIDDAFCPPNEQDTYCVREKI